MNFLEAIFDFISSLIGNILRTFLPIINLLIDILNKAQNIINQIISTLNNITPNQLALLFVGPIQIVNFIICAILTIAIWILNKLLDFTSFVFENPDLATYLILVGFCNFISFVPSVYELLADLPPWYFQLMFIITILPLFVGFSNYFIYGMNAKDAIQATKQQLLNPSLSTITNNIDVIVYISIIILIALLFTNEQIYTSIHEAVPKFVFLSIVFSGLLLLAYPLLLLIYYIATGERNFKNLITLVRQNAWTLLWHNIDIVIYILIAEFFCFSLVDLPFQDALRSLMPEFVVINLYVLFGTLLLIPLFIILYYFIFQQSIPITQLISDRLSSSESDPTTSTDSPSTTTDTTKINLFDAFLLFRQDIDNIKQNYAAMQRSLLTIKTTVKPPQDPNPDLSDTERMFFAQLFSDNPGTCPSKVYYPGSVAAYSGSYIAPSQLNITNGLYGKVKYEDLNQEFYGNPNYNGSLYPQFFGKTMTRADYIALPFSSLSATNLVSVNGLTISQTVINKLTNLVFSCLKIEAKASLQGIDDSILKDFATGKQQCYGTGPNDAWPTHDVQAKLWPTIDQIIQPVKPTNINDPQNPKFLKYIASCNQAFIYYSFSDLINNLSNISDGFNESLERWNKYLEIWSADDLTNPNFTKSPSDLASYVYTFADCIKNVVMFNDYLSYALLPTSSQSALASQTLGINTAYQSQIYTLIQKSNDPNSSANLFAVADNVLELVASGIDVTQAAQLYMNLRQTNAKFLFDRDSSPYNPVGSAFQQALSYVPSPTNSLNNSITSYSLTTLNAINSANQASNNGTLVGANLVTANAQMETLLESFVSNIDSTRIQKALNDAPTRSGYTLDSDGKKEIPDDYGSPYIRRLFYDASGVLSTIYTDIFAILRQNIFVSGSSYVPSANDPIDLLWFRYTVQNWNNPFDGSQYGYTNPPKTDKVNGSNSYLCLGYQDGAMHRDNIITVLKAINDILYTNNSGVIGIYDRIFSLLDYVTAYNNIVDKAFTIGVLGSKGSELINNLINNLSNKYLRLGQNDRYMDLTSLLPSNFYQHFHINLNLNVPKYSTSNNFKDGAAPNNISNIADLGKWVSSNTQLDPNYLAFKNEIATVFIFKIIWDVIWWPQFCYEYYYRDGLSMVPNANPSTSHRFNFSGGIASNPLAKQLFSGYNAKFHYQLYQSIGFIRENSEFFQATNRASYPNLYDLINGIMPSSNTYYAQAINQEKTRLTAANPFIWKSFCYGYRHDALIPYTFFTSTVQRNNQNMPLNYSQLSDLYTGGSMNTLLTKAEPNYMSTYRFLTNYTSIGSMPDSFALNALIQPEYKSDTSHSTSDKWLLTKFAPSVNYKKIMRTQFFADPFSWINPSKCYQIYPFYYGQTEVSNDQYLDGNSSTNWIQQDYIPMYTRWGSDFGNNDFYHRGDAPTQSTYDAYAPLLDISLKSK